MKAVDANIESISKAVEFIENNLKEEITIADIADAVYYSLYHFCRMFNTIIHHTPYDYLMRRRLSESALELFATERKIIEIAFDYQFNSHETFSRAFKRMFGMQPSQWRKQGKIDKRFFMSRLTREYIQHINRGDYLKPVLKEKDAFYIAGLMTLVKEEDNKQMISQLWDFLAQELGDLNNQVNPKKYYGMTYYPRDWENQGIFYMAGTEVESPDIEGSAMVVKTIPASKYARFIHKGPLKALPLTLDYIYHTWLPKSGKNLSWPLEIICYGQDFRDPDTEDSEREMYIPVT
jgi:AraC family transcriptional regulator